MRIEFERTGGVAGMRLAATTASAALPEPQARELARLVDDSRFFDLPARIDADSSGADRFSYAITIDDGARSHTVQVNEAAAPATLRPLIGWLTQAARGGETPPAR